MKGCISTALAAVAFAAASSALACEDMKKADADALFGANTSQTPVVLACGSNCDAMPAKTQDTKKAAKKPEAAKKPVVTDKTMAQSN